MARSRPTLGGLGHNLSARLAVISHSDLQVPQCGMQGSQVIVFVTPSLVLGLYRYEKVTEWQSLPSPALASPVYF